MSEQPSAALCHALDRAATLLKEGWKDDPAQQASPDLARLLIELHSQTTAALEHLASVPGHEHEAADHGARHDHHEHDDKAEGGKGMATLHTIRRYLAQQLESQGSLAADEELHYPDRGENSDCNEQNTLSVDSFLFDADDVDDMIDAGDLPSHYCQDCGSRNISRLTFISHSMSLHQLKFMYNTIIPQYCPTVRHVVDIGSRLGAVLFAGCCLRPDLTYTGVEVNSTYAAQQRDVIDKFNLKAINVVEGDVRQHTDLLQQADLVVLHNVFEFFGDKAYSQELWLTVLQALTRSNTFILSVPAIEESLDTIGLPSSSMSHLKRVPIAYPEPVDEDDEFAEDAATMFLYTVVEPHVESDETSRNADN
ncbi:hypothetical protein PTSG_04484 [Salpingoeca rosetta]|uniref:Methyltransferase domain-containing protein n=1 Tax=Salpingoeca rosetta (strain ATCC 50818 / BSB-021) TaxID=946362 RepID=F2U8P6_SALR5|nr:uncharacterized protein PTSG_04484 [Salpingoeca rosetta]EGD72754.1 hypothetical protein PTSG_04484 [Salpingoeca rosetta]|eukprot:XP_004994577.1 hypothetical protein PTSG_04484 [Salpingoeca rosetta]